MPSFLIVTERKLWNYYEVDAPDALSACLQAPYKGKPLGFVEGDTNEDALQVCGPYKDTEELMAINELEFLEQ